MSDFIRFLAQNEFQSIGTIVIETARIAIGDCHEIGWVRLSKAELTNGQIFLEVATR